ncbi:MAG TPA: 6-carboxytetrahydropterin synthase [Phycisphaerales bacterium]|nr:6-carboxytetrahydropterin synthase [Phycisphaerales bacterium]
MIELARSIRFSVSLTSSSSQPGLNGLGGNPPMRGIGAFYELEIRCQGTPDPQTGYLVNISALDRAARLHAVPAIEKAVQARVEVEPTIVLRSIFDSLRAEIGAIFACIRWRLTPYYCIAMSVSDTNTAMLSQQFEFSASHRLACPSLSETENHAIFGKCSNPNGHGHNYRIEPTIAVPLNNDGTPRSGFNLLQLERIVHDEVLIRFDHKHLNLDTPEFAAVNPSVENISRVCFDILQEPIRNAGGRLVHVSVWETEKTRCTYPAPPAATMG